MQVFATAPIGAAELLAEECRVHGFRLDGLYPGGVKIDINAAQAARALVHLRLADTLLLQVGAVPAPHANRLYHEVRDMRWERWIGAHSTVSVTCTGVLPDSPEGLLLLDPQLRRPPRAGAELRSHGFAARKIADAIVDRVQLHLGARPEIAEKAGDIQIVAMFDGDSCALHLDLAGTPLFRRGVKLKGASLRGTWAATVAAAAGWRGRRPLVSCLDPGGALLIEALWRSLRIAPNSRREFAVEAWPNDGERLHGLIEQERARAQAHETSTLAAAPDFQVLAAVHERREMRLLTANLEAAGLVDWVRVERLNARRMVAPAPGSVLLSSPPGQARLGAEAAATLTVALGDHWRSFVDCDAWVLTDDPDFKGYFGQRPHHVRPLSDGDREASLLHYQLGGASGAAKGERAN